jgi:translation initiation factor IF-3
MAMRRRFRRPEPRAPQVRINHRIRVPEVLVVAEDGSNLGVLPTSEALKRAQQAGLDLVEINPKGQPPVCKILDFGKFKYEESKRKRETKRKQTVVEVKEIKVRPKTDDHDLEVKLRAARKFLEAGNKVKVVCRFRGREITHPEIARGQLEEIVKGTDDLANVELPPTMEGRAMAVVLAPRQSILQRVAQERARREHDREAEREQDRLKEAEERAARRKRQKEAEAARAAATKSVLELGGEPSSEDEDFDDEDEDEDFDDEDEDEDFDDEDEDEDFDDEDEDEDFDDESDEDESDDDKSDKKD